jgi:hypothetical protein
VVNTEDRALALLARANPMPDTDSLELDADAVTYLATLQQRSSEVTKLETRPVDEDRKSRNRLIAVAATVVVILGAAIVLLTQANEEPPVASDPAPTTLAVPTTEPETTGELSPQLQEALAVATAFTEGRANRDIEVMRDNGIEGHVNGFFVGSLERMPQEFAWLEAVGWTTDIGACEVINPDPEVPTVECAATHSNAISSALGEGPFDGVYRMKLQFAGSEKLGTPIDQTSVTEALDIVFPSNGFVVGTWRPFLAWVEEAHPGATAGMLGTEVGPTEVPMVISQGQQVPLLTDESIDLWRQYSAEFVGGQE